MRHTVFVFKTNLQNAFEVEKIKVLDNIKGIVHWNMDLEDCDKILRVVATGVRPERIIQVMGGLNFSCEELV